MLPLKAFAASGKSTLLAGLAFPDVASWSGQGVMKINPLLPICPLSNRERDVGDRRPSVQRIDSIMKSVSLIEIVYSNEIH